MWLVVMKMVIIVNEENFKKINNRPLTFSIESKFDKADLQVQHKELLLEWR